MAAFLIDYSSRQSLSLSLSVSLSLSLFLLPSLLLSLRVSPSASLFLSLSRSLSLSLFLLQSFLLARCTLPLHSTARCPPSSAGCRPRFSSFRASFLFLVSRYFSLISPELSKRPRSSYTAPISSISFLPPPPRLAPSCYSVAFGLRSLLLILRFLSSLSLSLSRLAVLHARPRDRCLSHERSIRIWCLPLGLLARTSLSLRARRNSAPLASSGMIFSRRFHAFSRAIVTSPEIHSLFLAVESFRVSF